MQDLTLNLPEVGSELIPALDQNYLKKNYSLDVTEFELTDVVRQTNESEILLNATKIREEIRNQRIELPVFRALDSPDFQRITGSDFEESLNNAYSSYGLEKTIILCRSNKRANLFNREIRNRILFREYEISSGDILMVVRNNYFWTGKDHPIEFIANGDMITLALIQGVVNTFVIFFSRIIGQFVDKAIFKSESGHGPGFWITTIIAELLLGILASIIVMYFSRRREFRADRGGSKLAGKEKMIAALERLRAQQEPALLPDQLAAFGISGRNSSGFKKLFMSHPPLDERIEALRSY